MQPVDWTQVRDQVTWSICFRGVDFMGFFVCILAMLRVNAPLEVDVRLGVAVHIDGCSSTPPNASDSTQAPWSAFEISRLGPEIKMELVNADTSLVFPISFSYPHLRPISSHEFQLEV
jgi:hypothetical protein